jgi:tRNA(Arg) A34 adenosine deaminase TadA
MSSHQLNWRKLRSTCNWRKRRQVALESWERFVDAVFRMVSPTLTPSFQLAIGAIIVDPVTKHIVTTYDTRRSHPLQHAVMNAIAAVAAHERERRAGVTVDSSKSIDGLEGGLQQTPIDELLSDEPNIKKRKSVDQGPETDNAEDLPEKASNVGYLCTQFDLFVTREPCVM